MLKLFSFLLYYYYLFNKNGPCDFYIYDSEKGFYIKLTTKKHYSVKRAGIIDIIDMSIFDY